MRRIVLHACCVLLQTRCQYACVCVAQACSTTATVHTKHVARRASCLQCSEAHSLRWFTHISTEANATHCARPCVFYLLCSQKPSRNSLGWMSNEPKQGITNHIIRLKINLVMAQWMNRSTELPTTSPRHLAKCLLSGDGNFHSGIQIATWAICSFVGSQHLDFPLRMLVPNVHPCHVCDIAQCWHVRAQHILNVPHTPWHPPSL